MFIRSAMALEKAGNAQSLSGMRTALRGMSNALSGALRDCGLSGSCAQGFRNARNAVDALYKALDPSALNKQNVMNKLKAFVVAFKSIEKSCSMGLTDEVSLSEELFSFLELPESSLELTA